MKAFFIMSLTVNVKLEKLRLWMWLFYDWVYALFFQAALRVLTTVKVFSSSLKKQQKKTSHFLNPSPLVPQRSQWYGQVESGVYWNHAVCASMWILSGWYLLRCWSFCDPTWYDGVWSWTRVSHEKFRVSIFKVSVMMSKCILKMKKFVQYLLNCWSHCYQMLLDVLNIQGRGDSDCWNP